MKIQGYNNSLIEVFVSFTILSSNIQFISSNNIKRIIIMMSSSSSSPFQSLSRTYPDHSITFHSFLFIRILQIWTRS